MDYQVPYRGYCLIDAVGAIYEPGAAVSVCPSCYISGMAGLHTFWFRCNLTLFSPVLFHDPFNDSAFASPWRLFPGRLNESGFRSSPRCPEGSTPSRCQDRMPRQGHPKRIGRRFDPHSSIRLLVAHVNKRKTKQNYIFSFDQRIIYSFQAIYVIFLQICSI